MSGKIGLAGILTITGLTIAFGMNVMKEANALNQPKIEATRTIADDSNTEYDSELDAEDGGHFEIDGQYCEVKGESEVCRAK